MFGLRLVPSLVLASVVALSYTAAFGWDAPRQEGKPAKKESAKDDKAKPTDDKKAVQDEKKGDEQPPSESGLSDARTIDFINKQIEKGWKDNKIQPSGNA